MADRKVSVKPTPARRRPRKRAQKPHPLALGLSALTLLLVLGFFAQSALSLNQNDEFSHLVQFLSQ